MKNVTIVDCWNAFNNIIDLCMFTNVPDNLKIKRIESICWNIVLKLGREYENERRKL